MVTVVSGVVVSGLLEQAATPMMTTALKTTAHMWLRKYFFGILPLRNAHTRWLGHTVNLARMKQPLTA